MFHLLTLLFSELGNHPRKQYAHNLLEVNFLRPGEISPFTVIIEVLNLDKSLSLGFASLSHYVRFQAAWSDLIQKNITIGVRKPTALRPSVGCTHPKSGNKMNRATRIQGFFFCVNQRRQGFTIKLTIANCKLLCHTNNTIFIFRIPSLIANYVQTVP